MTIPLPIHLRKVGLIFGFTAILIIVPSLYVYREQKNVLSEEDRRENEGPKRVRKEKAQSTGDDKR